MSDALASFASDQIINPRSHQFPFVASKLYCTFLRYLVAKSAAVFTDAFARRISFKQPYNQGNVRRYVIMLTSKQWLSSRTISVHFDFGTTRDQNTVIISSCALTVFFKIRSRSTAWRSACGFSIIASIGSMRWKESNGTYAT